MILLSEFREKKEGGAFVRGLKLILNSSQRLVIIVQLSYFFDSGNVLNR